MASVDKIPFLADKLISGGRLNVARALTKLLGQPNPPMPPTPPGAGCAVLRCAAVLSRAAARPRAGLHAPCLSLSPVQPSGWRSPTPSIRGCTSSIWSLPRAPSRTAWPCARTCPWCFIANAYPTGSP